MAVIVKRIWLRRNKFIFESLFIHPRIIYSEAVAPLEEYQRCNKKSQNDISSVEFSQTIPRPQTGWCPPPIGLIKVNWDASINITKECISIDVVARDSYGNVLRAKPLTKMVVAIPKLAEAMAAYEVASGVLQRSGIL
jgi:hypothetical protein